MLSGLSGAELEGYEIHMGASYSCEPFHSGEPADGMQSGNVYGCYIHGLFDHAQAAEGFVRALLKQKGYDPEDVKLPDWKDYREEQYDKLADMIRASLDMEAVYRIAGL